MAEQATTADLQLVVDEVAKALLGTLQVQSLVSEQFQAMAILTTALARIIMEKHGIQPDALFASIKGSIPSDEGREVVRLALGARVPLTIVEGGRHD